VTAAAPVAELSEAQIRVLALLAEGYVSKEIARATGTTTVAVNHLIERATRRLEAAHRTHAVARAIRLGLID
jgi:DNA-binding CsgD family transcriptional regulator